VGHPLTKLSHRLAQPDWWTAIFSGVVALTAICALWYAHSQIQEAHDEAQIQHLVTLVGQFDQEPMATYRKSLADKRLNTKDDDPKELYRILDFYETVGRLVDRGYLNEDDVWDEFGYWVLHLNSDTAMRENVEYEEKQNPNEYAVYQRLVDRLLRIDKARGGQLSNLTASDVTDFYREELTIVGGTPTTHGHSARAGK
jgi:hypothetical protein